ncbi:MAG: DNA (cytosine-5-)-methyltransferase [Bacteroidetes bacterium]|nr:MAG: DNA (cytosine-5-)-methyltransferase [Bacteroidota bacterium]
MTEPDATYDALCKVRKFLTQKEIASSLGVDTRTVKRWEAKESSPPPYVAIALQRLLPFRETPSEKKKTDFTFIDLFAGIGGIRLGFESAGGQCVYTSEWNKYAVQTYVRNFGSNHPIDGDITQIEPANIPDHDVLLAGFPCQPFSIAGVSKKNSLGRSHGFACEAQGTLFFDIANILRVKHPPAILLENVKNLMSHDKGNTFKVIKKTLEEELGYTIFPMIIDAKGFVPQHRERIYIVGFREPVQFSWDKFIKPDPVSKKMRTVLHPENGTETNAFDFAKGYITGDTGKVNEKYTLSDKLWNYLQGYAAKHKAKGNGFGFGLVGPNDIARTLSARYYKDGSEILVDRGKGKNPRRLTPRECARLMGFPDDFIIPVSDTQAYKQFGNSVVVPVIAEIARIMKPFIMQLIHQSADQKKKQAA